MTKKIDMKIPDKLLTENRLRILGNYTGSKNHHDLECLECGHEWSATPKSKIQTLKKYGVSGCPVCKQANLAKRTLPDRLENLKKRGLVIFEYDYNGRYEHPNKKGSNEANVYLTVFNRNCGHGFTITAKNLFGRDVKCGVCNTARKRKFFQDAQAKRSAIYQKTAPKWLIYRYKVERLTDLVYEEYKNEINPMGLPRTRAGIDGGYQLDHITTKKWCFENNKSPEWCARKENLRMLTWEDNLGRPRKT